jgi:hypothetical protein
MSARPPITGPGPTGTGGSPSDLLHAWCAFCGLLQLHDLTLIRQAVVIIIPACPRCQEKDWRTGPLSNPQEVSWPSAPSFPI